MADEVRGTGEREQAPERALASVRRPRGPDREAQRRHRGHRHQRQREERAHGRARRNRQRCAGIGEHVRHTRREHADRPQHKAP